MKKNTSKKMMNYGAMSAAILATAAASGQVLYTDIDDVTIDETGGTVEIDLNQDAVIDFVINMGLPAGGVSFTTRAGDGTAAPTDPPTTNVNGAFVGVAAGGFQYPALLALDDVVDNTGDTTDPGARGDLNFYGCAYDNSQFCGNVTDGYIGLIFDFNGNTHFGWVQLDSNIAAGPGTAAGTATVKGYALELTPNTAILAGDTALSIEDVAFENFNYSVANQALTMSSKTAMQNVTIFSITGQQVINKNLSSTNESIELSNLNNGIYIATVTVDGKAKSFKFVK